MLVFWPGGIICQVISISPERDQFSSIAGRDDGAIVEDGRSSDSSETLCWIPAAWQGISPEQAATRSARSKDPEGGGIIDVSQIIQGRISKGHASGSLVVPADGSFQASIEFNAHEPGSRAWGVFDRLGSGIEKQVA